MPIILLASPPKKRGFKGLLKEKLQHFYLYAYTQNPIRNGALL